MKIFFTEYINDDKKIALIKGKELHHLKYVLRLKKGDKIIVFDGKERKYVGSIKIVNRNDAHISLDDRLDIVRESHCKIILAQGLARAEKMDMIIQKATELGISEIVPFTVSRVISKLNTKQAENKNQRWQRIATEAVKQCRRDFIPIVRELATFEHVLNKSFLGMDKYLKIIPWEGEVINNLKDMLKHEEFSGCIVLIGPEGGFEQKEVALAEKSGFLPVTLGPRILRTETAAISVTSIIQYELGDMGGTFK